MQALTLSNATRTLAKDQPEYTPLDILDEEIDGVNHMSSFWVPNQEELDALNRGAVVRLVILGASHPPVGVLVENV